MPTIAEDARLADAERALVEMIHRVLRESLQPHRPSTSDEIRERAGQLARMAPELMEAGFTEEEVADLIHALLARVIEARVTEQVSETLSHTSLFRPPRTRGFGGHFGHFALSDG